jgi:nicotinamide mononucleotide transporter
MSWIELIAVVFGLVAVWLSVKRSRWTWPAGLVQCTLSLWVFSSAKLYSDTILYSIYVAMQLYGWFNWTRRDDEYGIQLRVTRLDRKAWLTWPLLIVLGSVVWGFLMDRLTDAVLPYADALIAVGSLVAMWLLARKVLENWWFWIAVDLLAIGVYFSRDLYAMAALHAVFVIMCWRGLVEWRTALRVPSESSGL